MSRRSASVSSISRARASHALIGLAFATYFANALWKARGCRSSASRSRRSRSPRSSFLPPTSIEAIYGLEARASALTYAPTIPLLWAMFADTADYSGVEDGSPCSTGVVFGDDPVRAQDGPQPRRRDLGFGVVGLRVSAERHADSACAVGHSSAGQHLSSNLPDHRRDLLWSGIASPRA